MERFVEIDRPTGKGLYTFRFFVGSGKVWLLTNQPIRLPGLPLDFARDGLRDGEPFDRLRAMSCIEGPVEPKPGVCSGLILSGAFYLDLKNRGLAPSNVSNFERRF